MRILDLMRASKKGRTEPELTPLQAGLLEWINRTVEEEQGKQAKGSMQQFQTFLPIILSMIASMSDSDIIYLQFKIDDLCRHLDAINSATIETGGE